MPIPDLLFGKIPEPRKLELYRQVPMPPEGWPDGTTPQALKASCDKAHDNLKVVVRDRDRLQHEVIEVRRDAALAQRWQLKIFLSLMGATWAVLGGLLKWLIPFAIRGMTK